MEAKELRIGNILTINTGQYVIVDGVYSHKLIRYTIKDTNDYVHYGPELENKNELSPVIITPEVLVKCGFKESPSKTSYYVSIPEVKGEIHFEKFRNGLVCVAYCSTGSFIPNDIKYLHQLQNLYLALIGNELEINL